MTLGRCWCTVCLTLGLSVVGSARAQIAVSDFATGTDGWATVANSTAPVLWQTGQISQVDIHTGTMGFKAPSKFRGNVLAAYSGTLSFEMSTSAADFGPSVPKVRLSGNTSTGVITLNHSLPVPEQADTFIAHTLTLDESAPWVVVGQGRAPTSQEFQDVLSTLSDLRIIGETTSVVGETFGLRNVRLDPPPQEPPSEDSLRVYILAGQSNMAGCDDARNVDPMWQDELPQVMMYWGNAAAPGFMPLGPGTSGASCSNPAPAFYFGPELAFGSDVAISFPDENIVIIKFAVGGTSLYDYWTTPSREYPSGGILWNQLKGHIDDALAELDAMDVEYHVEAFLWMQGESDADKRYRAKAYGSKLSSFIASMRQHVGDPELPFILGRIRDAGQPHADMVRAAQVSVATNIPNVYWFDTDDLPWLPDGIHYDEPSMIELGHRFADIVLSLP